MSQSMDASEFDRALVASAFALAGEQGWARLSVAEAARRAGLPLDRTRARFPGRLAVLARFGRMADQAALAEVSTAAATAATSTPGTPAAGTPAPGVSAPGVQAPETAPLGTPPVGMPGTEAAGTGMSGSGGAGRDEPVRDQLFSLLMRRIDVLAAHRAGVLALLRAAPADPPLALWLGCATRRSMRWMLEAAGVGTRGLRGELRVKGLVAVWLWTVRAWQADESADLAHTMAALDSALGRVERMAGWLGGGSAHTVGRAGAPAEASPREGGIAAGGTAAPAAASHPPAEEPPPAAPPPV